MASAVKEVLWKCGYAMTNSVLERLVKNSAAVRVSKLKNRLFKTRNMKQREVIRNQWVTIEIRNEDMETTPLSMMEENQKSINCLLEKNKMLKDNLETKLNSLYETLQKKIL